MSPVWGRYTFTHLHFFQLHTSLCYGILESYLIMLWLVCEAYCGEAGIYFRIVFHDGVAMVGVLQCVGYISYQYGIYGICTGCFFTGTPLKSMENLG